MSVIQAEIEINNNNMDADTTPAVATKIKTTLYAWRTKALNALLVTAVVAALPVMGDTIARALRDSTQWPAALAFLAFYLFLASLAVFRRIDTSLRAWGFLLIAQATAALATARGGLAGDGRVYLIAIPILALIKVGERSAFLMMVISLASYVAFAILASQGQLEKWLIISDNPVTLDEWIHTGAAMLLALMLVMVLLWYFQRFLVGAIEAEQQASMELARTRDLLEEYNQTLEQKVEQRTIELQESITEREQLQQQIISAQQQAIRELSSHVIPIMDRIIVMPLIGSIDTMRARDITRSLMAGIHRHQARVVILDITGVPVIDSGVANHLNQTIQAARLKGAHTIITGISDAVAETIVDLGIDWSGIDTLADLQTGLVVALKRTGVKLSK